MNTVEIQEHARKLYDALGDKAVAEAAQKAVALERQGNADEAEIWRKIEKALAHMRGAHES
jgi:hypothetical protein